MLALLREIQRLWEEDGKSDAGVAEAARMIGESLGDASTGAQFNAD